MKHSGKHLLFRIGNELMDLSEARPDFRHRQMTLHTMYRALELPLNCGMEEIEAGYRKLRSRLQDDPVQLRGAERAYNWLVANWKDIEPSLNWLRDPTCDWD
jgi:hypothetical protein